MHGTFNKTDPINQLLLNAADLIEKHGHCKGQLYNEKGQMCLMGALNRVHQNYVPQVDATAKVAAVLGLSYVGTAVIAVVDWNNAPERTGQEVIDVLRLAAQA